MKKLVIFLLLFSSSVISLENKQILFENDIYQLSLGYINNCEKLNILDKKHKKSIPVSDRLIFFNYGFNLSVNCNDFSSISWGKSFDNNYNNGFLVLNYDLIGYVNTPEEKPKNT
ncbi:hypothetical protein [Rodentibacter genomosp. 2]|uniref:hypothetical protein n=1 Tax=Rodentibacter genomosp. 2 TaxID=1908266 RepID=UPI001AC00188